MAELPPDTDCVRTVVLIGKTGHGKSSLGNTILGNHQSVVHGEPIQNKDKPFVSKRSFVSVTTESKLAIGINNSGHRLAVIDTPGLYDFREGGTEVIANEIARCMYLAPNGIHAILYVLSVNPRFTPEDESTFQCLKTLFGDKFTQYMIIIFTNGDALDEDSSFEEFMKELPKPLKKIVDLCQNRIVLVDNKTQDKDTKSEQEKNLMVMLDKVMALNEGKPFTEILTPGKIVAEAGKVESEEQIQRLKQISESVERKYQENLAKEREFWVQRERQAEEARGNREKENRKLHQEMHNLVRNREEEIRNLQQEMHDLETSALNRQLKNIEERLKKKDEKMKAMRDRLEPPGCSVM